MKLCGAAVLSFLSYSVYGSYSFASFMSLLGILKHLFSGHTGMKHLNSALPDWLGGSRRVLGCLLPGVLTLSRPASITAKMSMALLNGLWTAVTKIRIVTGSFFERKCCEQKMCQKKYFRQAVLGNDPIVVQYDISRGSAIQWNRIAGCLAAEA